jgi:Leucine-rich repeat (LRR) protein
VVALRDRNLHTGFDVLNLCTSLQIAYLQNNNLTTDLHHLGKMTNLVKLNLSFNSI